MVFKTRPVDCIKNHVSTFLFYDVVEHIYFGYTHVDVEEKHWFGIYLIPEYRSKKYGDLLLNYTLQGIPEVYLSVDKENTHAIQLYEKNGFALVETNSVHVMKRTKTQ
jgi:ribosomal protein S18 acetylase RimI-like enzyme